MGPKGKWALLTPTSAARRAISGGGKESMDEGLVMEASGRLRHGGIARRRLRVPQRRTFGKGQLEALSSADGGYGLPRAQVRGVGLGA